MKVKSEMWKPLRNGQYVLVTGPQIANFLKNYKYMLKEQVYLWFSKGLILDQLLHLRTHWKTLLKTKRAAEQKLSHSW